MGPRYPRRGRPSWMVALQVETEGSVLGARITLMKAVMKTVSRILQCTNALKHPQNVGVMATRPG